MIRITEGPTRLKLTGDIRDIKDVAYKLRYRPLNYWRSPRYQAYDMTDGREGWDGYVSPIVVCQNTDTGSCLRGHKDALIATARRMQILLNLENCLQSPFANLVSDDLPADLIEADFELDEFQRESIVFWLKHGMGVNKIAVNGGKTAMFAAAAAMIKRTFPDDRILYITQRERLTVQAYTEMRRFLPGYDISQYGGSKKKKDAEDMVICTSAMLWTNLAALAKEKWFDTFIAVFYDESHHAASLTSQKLLMSMPCYFRFGASDTKREKDPGAVDKIRGLLGPIRYTVPVGTYIASGRSAKPTIYLVENEAWHNRFEDVTYQATPGTPAWALVGGNWRKGVYEGPVYEIDSAGKIKLRKKKELTGVAEIETTDEMGLPEDVKTAVWEQVEVPITISGLHKIRFDGDPVVYEVESEYCLLERATDKAIITFKERNEMIVDWTVHYAERGLPTLVVCTRTLHVLILEEMIRKKLGDSRVQSLYGEHTTKQRDKAFAWFKRTPGAVLVSPLVQEGVSINELRAGVIADYVGDWERANQIIGRFIRKKQTDNTSEITWFMDVQHPAFRYGSKRVFAKLFDIRGYTFRYPVLGPATAQLAKVYEKLDTERPVIPWK